MDPTVSRDMQRAARHLLQHPMTCAELHADAFLLVRMHEHELDRWFTQRLGYRLHTTATTARLYKSTVVPHRRPLRTVNSTKREFTQREYTFLALVLAAVAAGPRIISLRDLVADVRSAAVDAGVTLSERASDRRAFITAVRWMIVHGLAIELHDQVDRYIDDVDADAIVEFDPDRIALVPLPALVSANSATEVVDRYERRTTSPRQWMRARLAEDPVVYRFDLTDDEWSELRSRRVEEERFLDEMFDLTLESRAEGVAAIDPSGALSDRAFPATRTVGHAALLLVADLVRIGHAIPLASAIEITVKFTQLHRARWAKDSVDDPAGLTQAALDLLTDHRLVAITGESTVDGVSAGDGRVIEALPAAARFRVVEEEGSDGFADERGTGAESSTGQSPEPPGTGQGTLL